MVGIEIPNGATSLVTLREILESDAFALAKSPLKIALGKNVSGDPVVVDLAKMPHLLIAGATGVGQERLPQLADRLPAVQQQPRAPAPADDRPQDGRADHLQRRPAPACAPW